MDLFKYKVYCVTNAQFEYVWLESDDPAPTTCPVDTGHTIDSNQTAIVEKQLGFSVKDANGYAIVAPTYQETQGLKATWKGYLFTAEAGKLNIFDEVIIPEIKVSRGYYQIFGDPSSPDAAEGDYVEMSLIDKDDVLGLFSLYGLTVGTNEVQTITFSATPISGTFTITYNAATTGLLVYNIDASTLEQELRDLTGYSGIFVTGSVADGFEVTFSGTAGNMNHPELTSDDSLLVGATISHATTTAGVDGDVLELAKHVRKEYINPHDVARQYFEAESAQDVMSGLYFRFYYNSTGSTDVTFKVLSFFYEA